MAKFRKRLRAQQLRRLGWSVRAIAAELKVSRSSASVWCRDIKLTKREQVRLLRNAMLAGHAGRVKGAEVNRKRKEERVASYLQLGARVIRRLSRRDLLIAGTALYWAEGSRRSKLSFVNSEPAMVVFMTHWFREILGVKKEEFMPRIFINAIHAPRLGVVLSFWAKLLHLPIRQFGKPVLLKRRPRKVYENYDSYYGVLALGVRRSTNLKYRILGLIDALKNKPV